MSQDGQTLTERTRKQLVADAATEFRVSRAALETLVADSERYAELSGQVSAAIPLAQKLRDAGELDLRDAFATRQTTNGVFALVDAILGEPRAAIAEADPQS